MSAEKLNIARAEHEAFLVQLGELTLGWSDVENALFTLLKHYSCVSWPVAQALFSGTRARSAMNFIHAIAENTAMDQSRVQDLEAIFSQIGSINSMRDFVVHNVDGSIQEFEDWDPSKRYVTDERRASRKSKSKTYLIGSDTLASMVEDCAECCWRLHPHWDPQNEPFKAGSGRGRIRPWKFKPPNPSQRRSRAW